MFLEIVTVRADAAQIVDGDVVAHVGCVVFLIFRCVFSKSVSMRKMGTSFAEDEKKKKNETI